MKKTKIFTTLLLVLLMMVSFAMPAFAETGDPSSLVPGSEIAESTSEIELEGEEPAEAPPVEDPASSEEAPPDETEITPPDESPDDVTVTPSEDVFVVGDATSEDVEITDESVQYNPRTRAGYAIVTGTNGVRDGALSATNSWDYHLFLPDEYWSMARMVTTNSAFTMTLAVANIDTGIIDLTGYVLGPNDPHTMDMQSLVDVLGSQQVLAWVIQSTDGSAGTYKLQYNVAIPLDSSRYQLLTNISADYQTWSMVLDGRFYQNGVQKTLSYLKSYGFDLGGSWNTTRIWVYNPNVRFVYAGGCGWKEGITNHRYPNSIIFQITGGGTFEHEFTQNPPYVNWGTNDAKGYPTPRQFGSEVNAFPSYMIYDLDTGKVVNFYSELSKEWSSRGDHSGFYQF